MSRILYLGAHSILEHDDLRLFHSLGHDVFSLGAYIEPAAPHVNRRAPLPELTFHPELKAVVDGMGTEDNLTAAKTDTPRELLDWADVIVCAAFEHTWVWPQWERLKSSGKRVIWRTIGQSVQHNEEMMASLFKNGLEIVRYSPKERLIPGFAGESALIRFYKDPDEWTGWVGDKEYVLNVTQHLRQREPFTNWRYWELATKGLARVPMGPGSEDIGGPGEVSEGRMKEALRRARCYLSTGTQPASYTLGHLEAGMTGTPLVTIGPSWHTIHGPYGPDMFEAHELTPLGGFDDDQEARSVIQKLFDDRHFAGQVSKEQRAMFVKEFGFAPVRAAWAEFIGAPADEVRVSFDKGTVYQTVGAA